MMEVSNMDINIDISVRNMELTDRLENYIEKKVAKLERYLNNIEEMRVDLAYAKSARNIADRQVSQITIRGKGYILRAEERSDDIFAAIDAAVEKMQRQIERYKGKRKRGRGDGTSISDIVAEPMQEDLYEDYPVIARRKTFLLVPMDEIEALEQMKLLGHENFFIFFNADTNAINVLYKRRDDTYGLIEPELG